MHIVGSSFLAHVITTTRLSASVAGEAISFKRAKRKHASNLHIQRYVPDDYSSAALNTSSDHTL